MSSTYRPICLNHNPALTIDREIHRDAVDSFNSRDGLGDHLGCDIVIGRWSGALCEIACIGRQLPGPTGCKGYHSSIEWTDKAWLRLLLAAAPSVDAALLRPLVSGCWPIDRLERLRTELDLPMPPDTDDQDEGLAPARPGIPRCTATWPTTQFGTFTCWRAATHNQETNPQHAGESASGWRFSWLNGDLNATPHTDIKED